MRSGQVWDTAEGHLPYCHNMLLQWLKFVIYGPAESVAERSEAVNSKLQLRRDQIEELSQVKNLLTKLQAVFDLPRRLRTALDRGALDIAADAYADAAPLLKRYGHKVCLPVSVWLPIVYSAPSRGASENLGPSLLWPAQMNSKNRGWGARDNSNFIQK